MVAKIGVVLNTRLVTPDTVKAGYQPETVNNYLNPRLHVFIVSDLKECNVPRTSILYLK